MSASVRTLSEGLYEKYTVIDNATGDKVDRFTFTLIPESDDAAVTALRAYAEATSNEFLRTAITAKLDELGA